MNRPIASLARLIGEAILPSLKAVQTSQAEQIAANNRLENSLDQLRMHILYIESQFAHISTQLTACRADLAATQAVFNAAKEPDNTFPPDAATLMN
jgi:hypothetical protein